MMQVGIINGSVRPGGNTSAFISALLPNVTAAHPDVKFVPIHLLTSPGHPLPPITEPVIPAMLAPSPLADEPTYNQSQVRAWSATILSLSAIVIVTPQHNWSIPATLKNALDHLYHEWRNIPVCIVTLGGHGGGKCAEHLANVCEGALKMRVVGQAGVTLSRGQIRGGGKGEGDVERICREDEEMRIKVAEVGVLVGDLVATVRSGMM